MTPQEIAAWHERYDVGNIQPGIVYAPYIPLQWVRMNFVVESPYPTWLDKLKMWDFESVVITSEENAHMAILRDEEIAKERERSQLLQTIARLEGTLDGNSKVTQDQFYSLLNIVREIVESR